MSNSPGGNSNE